MYNMNLSFFGYEFNVQILILICVIYLITLVHTITGCCRYSLLESFERMKNGDIYSDEDRVNRGNRNQDMSGSVVPSSMTTNLAKNIKGNVQNSEGFSGMNSKNGESTPFDLNKDQVVNTSSWFSPDMNVSSGKALSDDVKKFLDRKQQPLPLENGQMHFLANSEFKPDCCPSTYSTSSGCWCGTSKDYNYLVMRGGNNVPYSEY
jgi:hypothetical protein